MNIIYLILARKGSVRIKNKNLKKIKNKSLVEHSIEFTKKISKPDKIILSTDSEVIRKIGKKKWIEYTAFKTKKSFKSQHIFI